MDKGPDMYLDMFSVFDERLVTLKHLLLKAKAHYKAHEESLLRLLSCRIAPDMHPFSFQIVFACHQPDSFAAWVEGTEANMPKPDQLSYEQLIAHMDTVLDRVRLSASSWKNNLLASEKTMDLPQGILRMSGAEYIDQWLVPNFYFHLCMAYALIRQQGVEIGKADYMLHMVPRLVSHDQAEN